MANAWIGHVSIMLVSTCGSFCKLPAPSKYYRANMMKACQDTCRTRSCRFAPSGWRIDIQRRKRRSAALDRSGPARFDAWNAVLTKWERGHWNAWKTCRTSRQFQRGKNRKRCLGCPREKQKKMELIRKKQTSLATNVKENNTETTNVQASLLGSRITWLLLCRQHLQPISVFHWHMMRRKQELRGVYSEKKKRVWYFSMRLKVCVRVAGYFALYNYRW